MTFSGTGWAKWRLGLRCVLFAQAIAVVVNQPTLAIAEPNLVEDESWKIEIESLKYRASSRVVLEASK